MYERVLFGKEKTLGADHLSTLETVDNLGNLYRDQGKLEEAEQMYQRALAGHQHLSGKSEIFMLPPSTKSFTYSCEVK